MTLAFSADHELAHIARRALQTYGPDGKAASLDVAAADDMFVNHVIEGASPEQVVYGYFAVSVQVQRVLDGLVGSHFGGWDRVGSVLDFAAGYGRCTRLLVTQVPAERVWVAEVQHDALDFQRDALGVHTMRSHVDHIDPDGSAGFDVVVVVSLFTHLPRGTWQAWLERLWALVSPGGLLIFSTHAVSGAPARARWEDGFAFLPFSEVDVLDTRDYGSTFTTSRFVLDAITAVCGPDPAAWTRRLPLVFGGIQDVWAVPRPVATAPGAETHTDAAPSSPAQAPSSPAPSPTAPSPTAPQIDGAVDVVRSTGAELVLSGWAARLRGSPTRAMVSVQVGDGRIAATGEQKRNDVARHFGRPFDLVLAFSGWRARVSVTGLAPQTPLVVTASSLDGAQAVLLDSTVAAVQARAAAERADPHS